MDSSAPRYCLTQTTCRVYTYDGIGCGRCRNGGLRTLKWGVADVKEEEEEDKGTTSKPFVIPVWMPSL